MKRLVLASLSVFLCGALTLANQAAPPTAGAPAAAPASRSGAGKRSRPGTRRASRWRAGPETRAGLGRHPERPGPARIGRPCARDHRAARLRVRHVGHVHPDRLEHRGQRAQEDGRVAGKRRPEPEQRRRDFLHGAPRAPVGGLAEGGAAAVREGRQGLRRRARRADGARVLARVRRDAGRPLRSASDLRSRDDRQRVAELSRRPNTSPRPSRSTTSSTSPRISRATRSKCCCASTCRTCRPIPRCT